LPWAATQIVVLLAQEPDSSHVLHGAPPEQAAPTLAWHTPRTQ
jgi:hypothetical protein